MSDPPRSPAPPTADVRPRRTLPLIWLVPIIAGVVAAYLGWRTLSEQGPSITITFLAADGLTAGQTKVKHKAVDLGTVEAIELSHDMSHIIAHVRMTAQANQVLTDHARFWVVRPRLTPGSISGLETIVSGSFIELDPGPPGGGRTGQYTGLETPPPVRSDEPGRTFTLKADRLGSLSTGSLVVYRDIPVGEVLGYDQVQAGQPISIHAFIRAPYDSYVHEGSFFWNASGFSVNAGPEGVQVRLESLQAVIGGAVAFNTPESGRSTPLSKEGAEFRLFRDEATGASSHFDERLPFLIHFKAAVAGLAYGAKVVMYGMQVGTVTDIRLHFGPSPASVDVPVRIELEPQLFIVGPVPSPEAMIATLRNLVKAGLRAQLHTENYLTGQQSVALDFFPDSAAAEITMEGRDLVLPSQPGGFDTITTSLSAVASKLEALPLDQMGKSLSATLEAISKVAAGPELKQALQSLAGTMNSAQDLVKRVDAGLAPALKRVPEIAVQLEGAAEKLNKLAGSFESGYGGNSEFSRNLQRLLNQVSETARSVRLLADFLDQHPEALVRGRTGSATER